MEPTSPCDPELSEGQKRAAAIHAGDAGKLYWQGFSEEIRAQVAALPAPELFCLGYVAGRARELGLAPECVDGLELLVRNLEKARDEWRQHAQNEKLGGNAVKEARYIGVSTGGAIAAALLRDLRPVSPPPTTEPAADGPPRVKRFTGKQNEWLARYVRATGLEPVLLAEARSGKATFAEMQHRAIRSIELMLAEVQ